MSLTSLAHLSDGEDDTCILSLGSWEDKVFCERDVLSLLLGPSIAAKAVMTPLLSVLVSLRWSVFEGVEGSKG